MKMEPLRQAFGEMGFSNVATFIASGNVYFEGRLAETRALERKIEKGLEQAFGRPLQTFVRTATEMQGVAAYRAFSKADMASADINIVFLGSQLSGPAVRRLKGFTTPTDEFRVRGREVYWLRRRLPRRPDYGSIPLDKALQTPYTVRSQRTVEKMVAKHEATGDKGD